MDNRHVMSVYGFVLISGVVVSVYIHKICLYYSLQVVWKQLVHLSGQLASPQLRQPLLRTLFLGALIYVLFTTILIVCASEKLGTVWDGSFCAFFILYFV